MGELDFGVMANLERVGTRCNSCRNSPSSQSMRATSFIATAVLSTALPAKEKKPP